MTLLADVTAAATASNSGAGVLALLLVALGVAVLVGWLVARRLTRPLASLTAAAERVARGDLTTRIDVHSRDEVGRLAVAFNHMTDELQQRLDQLERSRDALRANVDRLGNALSSTHNLDAILHVVCQTAVSAVQVRCGVVLRVEGRGPLQLLAEVAEGRPPVEVSLVYGEGVLGRVAASGESVRGRIGGPESTDLQPAPGEPQSGQLLAVPIRRKDAVVAVLALYDREDGTAFTATDAETIHTLARQAGVAVDNVMLHEEAQRLAITDELTGLWNYRYLSMTLDRELERAQRFGRVLSVVMFDLDRFKLVNDTYGHQCGDAVLREVARRAAETTRDGDILARYGGEEFVVVLNETGGTGAVHAAERLRQCIGGTPFAGPEEEPLRISVSLGTASYPEHGASATVLLRAADVALYAAKRGGRDRIAVARTQSGDGSTEGTVESAAAGPGDRYVDLSSGQTVTAAELPTGRQVGH